MDYAIHDTTLEDIADAIRKNEGSVALIDPADFASRIGLMGMLPKGKSSGSIAHITDGADDVPTSSCEVEIAPTLTGVSSVSVVRTGKNLFDKSATPYQTSKYIVSTTPIGSSDFTYSGNVNYNVYRISVKPNTTYTMGIIKANAPCWGLMSTSGLVTYVYPNNGGTDGVNVTFTTGSNDAYLFLSVGVDGTYKCDDILQLEVGSTASAYEAYETPTTYTASLGRTIYGGKVDLVNGTITDAWLGLDLSEAYWLLMYGSIFGAIDDILYNLVQDPNDASLVLARTENYTQVADIWSSNNGEFAIMGNTLNDRQVLVNTADAQTLPSGMLIYMRSDSFTFTPVEIPTRLGVNNFLSENGDVSMEYRKDINLAIGLNKYRYLRWKISATRTTSSYCQMSDIEFSDSDGNTFTFPTGTTVTASTSATSGSSPAYIVDGNTATKFCGNWVTGGITLNIDLGMGNVLDVTVFDRFSWYTANDATDRDPKSWELYGIDNANNEILLCSRDYTPTTDRKALADTVEIQAQ